MKKLTPLGTRTLAGFNKQYGPDGEAKFRAAIERGVIDGAKMESSGDAPAGASPAGQQSKSNSSAPKPPGSTGRAAAGTYQSRPG